MRRRGISVVEFALSLPVLLVLVAVIIEFGWYVSRTLVVSRAAHDAARYGASVYEAPTSPPGTLSVPAAEGFALQILLGAGMPCGGGCTISAHVDTSPFETIRVEVDYPYQPIFGLVSIPREIHYAFTTAVEAQ